MVFIIADVFTANFPLHGVEKVEVLNAILLIRPAIKCCNPLISRSNICDRRYPLLSLTPSNHELANKSLQREDHRYSLSSNSAVRFRGDTLLRYQFICEDIVSQTPNK